ncbi:MAG: dihydroorotate dehydrogenase-like protein [Prevotellaceae bacterium]|jgi:dihydroorotate dehydrogenase (fumarate)|nr:dihydroorotate dehydrogenase-like protein [Prevotellaceae bacterium]
MKHLHTKYLGLELKSPVIAGSSGMTMSASKARIMAQAGAGAIVLKSLFEEQINGESGVIEDSSCTDYPEAADYIRAYTRSNSIDKYLDSIAEIKHAAGVPVIASVSCLSPNNWIDFAKQIENAGANAMELNLFYLPLDKNRKGTSYEQLYYDVVERVKATVKIPIAVKLGANFTNLLNVIQELHFRRVDGVVMFNKFYEPNIDINKMQIVPGNIFSHASDLRIALRWVAIVSAQIPQIDVSASTGIHDGTAAVKQLLAGARTVQMTSALYQNGPEYIAKVLTFITEWMEKHGFKTLDDFRGKLHYGNIPDHELYERSQFMKYFSSKLEY